jgi:hypothetical protein
MNLTDIFDDPPVNNDGNEENEENEKSYPSSKDLKNESSRNIVNNDKSEYVFRGFVCYYGSHYVSIFQERLKGGEVHFLLFDDQKIRPLGGWEAVKKECIKSCYQPVILLYELKDPKGVVRPRGFTINTHDSEKSLPIHKAIVSPERFPYNRYFIFLLCYICDSFIICMFICYCTFTFFSNKTFMWRISTQRLLLVIY